GSRRGWGGGGGWEGQGPGQRSWSAGRKRDGSTAGSGTASGRSSAEKGTVRPSRCPRVFAMLVRIRKIHVFSDERPSKRSIPFRTAIQVSCTTSSATERLAT